MDEKVSFIIQLNKYKRLLHWQIYKTIKGQALAGDVNGAKKGLQRVLNERMMRND